VWKGLQAITRYKEKNNLDNSDPAFPDQLNEFYARFDRLNTYPVPQMNTPEFCSPPFAVQEADVRRLFKRQNENKASGPDGVSSSVLKNCADQLAPIFTDIFNDSLSLCQIPSCFKSSVIVPIPKKAKVSTLNDYRPVALTSVVMKVLERLVLCYLKSVTDPLMDPMQFAYRANRSVEDAVSLGLHFVLQHLETPKTYARILFVDFSSAFNTIIPSKLVAKLIDLNVDTSLCRWISNFLSNRAQVVRVGDHTSGKLILNTGAPQGCVLSPLLFTLFTNEFRSNDPSVIVVKFSDDTTMEGLISNGDETMYRKEVANMVDWCSANNLELNVSKTKEIVIDFRKNKSPLSPLSVKGQTVQQVDSFKFLGLHISNQLTWDINTSVVCKKAHQRLYFLRQLKKFRMTIPIMTRFYRSVIESVLTFSNTVWYGSASRSDKTKLNRVVKTASKIAGCELPSIEKIYNQRVLRKAKSIISDTQHPANHLFQLLPSGRRYRCTKSKSTRLKNSFYPTAVKLLNL